MKGFLTLMLLFLSITGVSADESRSIFTDDLIGLYGGFRGNCYLEISASENGMNLDFYIKPRKLFNKKWYRYSRKIRAEQIYLRPPHTYGYVDWNFQDYGEDGFLLTFIEHEGMMTPYSTWVKSDGDIYGDNVCRMLSFLSPQNIYFKEAKARAVAR